LHEGRTVQWRSEASIIKELKVLSKYPDFTGYIRDIGGPTANMYGFECPKKVRNGICKHQRCLFPEICPILPVDHSPQTALLKNIRLVPGVKKVFVASGIRYDMVLRDKKNGREYLKEIVRHHVSGQLKVAPEHSEGKVLELMGKSGTETLLNFKKIFDELSEEAGKKQFLTYYFIAAHPGCDDRDTAKLKIFINRHLHLRPEQVQVFLPAPSTWSAVMYHTERDPFTGDKIYVEKSIERKERQKRIITSPSFSGRQSGGIVSSAGLPHKNSKLRGRKVKPKINEKPR
jgi:uncharacterized radical SAM protein YgiQ